MRVPSGLDHWKARPGGGAWLDRLPALAASIAADWGLTLTEPFEPASIALVIPCRTAGGGQAVLKLNPPDPESEHEADALGVWAGTTSARLLAHDPQRSALLLERCLPGDQLWGVEDDAEATGIAARVLATLLRPPPPGHPFRDLAGEARRWAAEIPQAWQRAGRPFDRDLVDCSVDAIEVLLADTTSAAVVSQDFHGGNIVRAERGWVAIDPKPLVGDPAFAPASLLRDRRWLLGDPAADVARLMARLDIVEHELGLDRDRLRLWGVVHALAWACDCGAFDDGMVASARILAGLG